MTALAQVQTPESLSNFESGSHKRKSDVVEEPFLTDNIYANKKQKMMNGQFKRGRFKFDEIGILRTKPGQ